MGMIRQEEQVEPNAGVLSSDIEKKIVAWAKGNFQSMKQARQNIERQWYINMAFYRGKQNVAFRQQTSMLTGIGNTLITPPAPYWRSRPVINRVKIAIRSELSRLTSQKPTAFILPASSDDRDMFAAQAGEQLWDSTYRSKKIPAKMRRALWWSQVCGTSFLKVAWDPDAVVEKATPEGEAQKGDFRYEPITPFHLFVPDLREEDLEEQPFIIHARLETQDWLQVNYPKVKLSKATPDRQSEILDDSWLDLLGAQMSKLKKQVLCLEVWMKPGKVSQFPNGGMFTVIGDTLVQNIDKWPYDHGCYPFAKLSHIPSGNFYAHSTINDLISPQREYNRTRGQIIEAKNKMGKPQLLAEKGSIDPSKITSEPGSIIEYQTGFQKPEPLQLSPLPAYVLQELDRILQDMSDISGQHEVSQGSAPPGVTAATAINFLQEQDDTMLSLTFANLEEAYEKIAYMTLSYVKQFWDVPRIVKIVGEDGYFDSMAFKGSQLRDNTDIKIEAGSALPISKAAKQAFIMDLMKMNFIDPATGLEVMEMGGIAKIYEAVQVDVRQAQRENLRMSQIDDQQAEQIQMQDPTAMIIPVNTWDNHQMHIATHNKYRKGQAFEQLSDTAKMEFEKHVQMHSAAMMGGQMQTNAVEMAKNPPMDPNQDPNAGGAPPQSSAPQMPPMPPGG